MAFKQLFACIILLLQEDNIEHAGSIGHNVPAVQDAFPSYINYLKYRPTNIPITNEAPITNRVVVSWTVSVRSLRNNKILTRSVNRSMILMAY